MRVYVCVCVCDTGMCMRGGVCVFVCTEEGWRTIHHKCSCIVYATRNLAASPHLLQLVVDFVENECPVIVSSVLLDHLVNCDLVREEGGGKKEEEGEGKE